MVAEARRPTVGSRCDRVPADGVPVGLTPLRLLAAQRPTELGHRRSPWHMVVGFPAVHGFELWLGERRGHVDIVRPPPASWRKRTRRPGAGRVLDI